MEAFVESICAAFGSIRNLLGRCLSMQEIRQNRPFFSDGVFAGVA